MTSEREAYVYIQLPGTLDTVPAALLKVQTLPDGTQIGRFRYGDRYLQRADAVALDPFRLPLDKTVHEFTQLKGIPGAVRDAAPDSWGRRVIEHKLERAASDLDEMDYLLHGPQDGAGYLSFGLKVEPPAPKRLYNRTHQLEDLVTAAQSIDAGRPVPARLLEQLEPGTALGGDGAKAYEGRSKLDHITFERDGKAESIRAGTGADTGMKWLAEKKDCLVIQPGEGFCRD
ncbi:MAG: hypothetical protein V4650_00040 [Pseudomonadota bacterium]